MVLVNKQQIDNIEIFKKNYYDYYSNHLKCQEIQNNLNLLNPSRFKNYELSTSPEKGLSESFNPINKILFILRKNISYQLKLIEYAEEKDEDCMLETLADLFSNRFYENILIQNAENEEFIILLFYLFKQEIESMHNASLSSFLDEDSRFIGKLLRLYTSRAELKTFLRMNFKEYIMKIQNQHPNIEIDTKVIFNYVKTKHLAKQASNGNANNNTNTNSGIQSQGDKHNKSLEKNFNNFNNNIIDIDNLGKSIKRSTLLNYVNYLIK